MSKKNNSHASLTIGSLGYYQERSDLFRQKYNKNPHPYYSELAPKYARKFQLEIKTQLSPKGQAWNDNVFIALQLDLEKQLKKVPQLEISYFKFHWFLLKSHVLTYLKCGYLQLSFADKWTIFRTIEWRDVFFPLKRTWNK